MPTSISSLSTAIAMGVSYLAILVPGQAFKDVYRERGLAAKNLSRTLEDSGTVFVPLVP
ncbi:Na+/H+ antiporter NhaC family protein [Streptomyces oryzae]|uniref:Na+/H+ antiporter NhaC family protein n=1 Tax=Streptomyces oryzae TaxID=1434886 RepID=UPI0027DB50BE|nr:Na+/H+ antiporter NhaC family protein [Streptomyces oryzae]